MNNRRFWITMPDADNVGNIYLSPDKQGIPVIECNEYESILEELQALRINACILLETLQSYATDDEAGARAKHAISKLRKLK